MNVNINKPTIHLRTSSCLHTQKSVYQICSDEEEKSKKDNCTSSYEDSSEEDRKDLSDIPNSNSSSNNKIFNFSSMKVNKNKTFQNVSP